MDISKLFMHNFTCFLQLFGTMYIVYSIIHGQEGMFYMNCVAKHLSNSLQTVGVQNLGTCLQQWGIY